MSDTITRMVLSVLATGIAPRSFYRPDDTGGRQRAHFDGLPVDFVAEAIMTLSGQVTAGVHTYHVMNPHDDGIGLDEYVDWLMDAGYRIRRIDDFDDWFGQFQAAVQALPERQRAHSVLQMMQLAGTAAPRPLEPRSGSYASTDRFRAAVQEAKVGVDRDIPHISAPVILRYATDLRRLGLL